MRAERHEVADGEASGAEVARKYCAGPDAGLTDRSGADVTRRQPSEPANRHVECSVLSRSAMVWGGAKTASQLQCWLHADAYAVINSRDGQ